MAIRPVYSKLVLPSRKSLKIIINIKIKKLIIKTKLDKKKMNKNGGCPLIRACSLIRSNTVCGFYEATQRLSCNYTSTELTQFDGRARGDDVIGNLTVSKLRAGQVTGVKLAYRCCEDS